MPSYIIPTGTQTIVLPSGLAAVITYVDAHDGSSVGLVSSGTPPITLDGVNEHLELIYRNDIDVTVTGGTYGNILVQYIGDQHAYRVMDPNIKPAAAGFYPGHWGTGIGSKPRNNPASVTESGWYPY